MEPRKRNDERRAKQEKATALQNQGRKSSSSERSSSSQTKAKHGGPPPAASDSETDLPSSPTTTDSSGQRREKRHTGYLPSDAYAPATSPMKEAVAEEEEEEEDEYPPKPRAPDGVVTPADLNAVPWHHAQLYKMYGRNADYYIHPKMQPEKKKIVNPTLKSQKGHLGASHIWTTLRRDSMNKLHKTDRRFPQELKSAFSSHVREGITNHRQPVYRNFTVTEDVPDLNRLMDHSLLRRIRVLRHKTELMFRSSQTNNDRTKVLLFNNPLPSVNEGDEGIDKYLPSWEGADEVESEMSYTKWLKKKGSQEEEAHNDSGDSTNPLSATEDDSAVKRHHRAHPESVLTPLGSEFSDSLHSVWDSIMARQRPRLQPKYRFLREEKADHSQGTFLEKLGLDKDKLDQGRVDLLPPDHPFTARSSLEEGLRSAPESRTLSRHSVNGPLPSIGQSAYETQWQPLSLNALVEYKEQMATQGAGDFHQGRPTMWRAGVASSVE